MTECGENTSVEPCERLAFFNGLGDLLARRPRRRLSRPRRAAVLVPVVDDGGAPRLILTRRTENLPTHKGQVAFPGGCVDPDDEGAVGAALREAEEEIGLGRGGVEVLGLLDDFPTLANDMAVTPVVARVRSAEGLRPQPSEVARIFEVPIDLLCRADRWTSRPAIDVGGHHQHSVYFFRHDGETLWGLSAYVVLHFLDVCWLGAPFEIPPARID